jgi:hypothetical protein
MKLAEDAFTMRSSGGVVRTMYRSEQDQSISDRSGRSDQRQQDHVNQLSN